MGIESGFAIGDVTDAAQQMAELVDGITEGVVEKAALGIEGDIAGLTGNTADDGSDVGDVGQFSYVTSEGRTVKCNLPAFNKGLVPSGTEDINTANPNVAALLAAMQTGITILGVPIAPCNKGEDDIVGLNYARFRHKNRGERA